MKTTKMMRFLLIVLSLVMALSLFSCSTEEPTETTPAGTDAPTEDTSKETTAETTVETTVSAEETETTGKETESSNTEVTTDSSETEATDTSETETTDTSETETTDSSETETTDTTEPECQHADKEEVAAKAPTCTEDGNEAYSYCPDCQKYFDAAGAEINAPVTLPAGHKFVEHEATKPTCTTDGNDAYKTCENCDVIFDEDGKVIDAAPIIIGRHKQVSVDAQEPTMTEKGWEAYKTCKNCDVIWNADGEEIDAIPYIDALSNLEIFLTPDVLATNVTNFSANADANNILEDADGTKYYRATPAEGKTIAGDGYLMFLEGNTKETGRYMVYKYRTNKTSQGESWANTLENGHSKGSANYISRFTTDGAWHIVIVDWATQKASHIVPDADGKYTIQWSRIDILNGGAAQGEYFDLAWVAYCDDLTDMSAVVTSDADKALCPHFYISDAECKEFCGVCGIVTGEIRHNNVDKYTDEGNVRTYESGCATCGEGYFTYTVTFGEERPNAFYGAPDVAGRINSDGMIKEYEILSEDGVGFARIHADTTRTGEAYFHLVPAGSNVNSGRYAVIKYRTTCGDTWQFYTGARKADGTMSSNAGSGNGFYTTSTNCNPIVADGTWQYMFIDLGALSNFQPNDDDTYTLTHFRWDIFDAQGKTNARYIDVAYIAFADDMTELTDMGANANCAHIADANGYSMYNDNDDSTFTAKLSATCVICNGIMTKDITIASHVSSVNGTKTGLLGGEKGLQTQSATAIGVTVGDNCALTVNLWSIFAGNADAGMFRVLDADGNVIVDWRDATKEIQSLANGKMTDAEAIARAANISGATADMARRFVLEANLIPAQSKTVTVEFALVWKEAVDAGSNDKLIPIYTITDVVVPEYICEHTDCTTYDYKDATCTEDGHVAHKACNACYKVFTLDGEELTTPVVIPAAHNTTNVDAKPVTCTEDGNEAYSFCSVCKTIWNADGEVIDAVPTITSQGHDKVAVPAKDATCTEDGCVAHTKCNNCDVLWNAEGTEIVDNVTTAPATNHEGTVETYAKKYATTAAKGNEAYSACTACGAMWDADGEVIFSIPEIAEIAPTTEKYFGFEELKGKNVNGVAGSLFAVEAAEDRSYVRFKRTGQADDGNIQLLSGNTEVTGQYLVMKYRTDHMSNVQIWANTTDNGHDGGKSNFYAGVKKDGQWHILIVDLSKSLSTYVVKGADEAYTIQWARIDMLDGGGTEGYFDIAYLVYCDDLADVTGILQEGDASACSHIAADDPVFTNRGDNHSTECVVCGSDMFYDHSISTPTWNYETKTYTGSCACGKTIESTMLFVTEAHTGTAPIGCMELEWIEAEGVVRYTVKSLGDIYFHVYSEGTAVTGKYAVIKYRLSNGGKNANFGNTFAGSIMDPEHSNATNNNDQCSSLGSAIGDGEWQYVVVNANSKHFIANADGTYSYKFLRLGLTKETVSVGSYIEIDEIAFADNPYAVNIYLNGDAATCSHVELTDGCEAVCKHCGAQFINHTMGEEIRTTEGNVTTYTANCTVCSNEVYNYSTTFGETAPTLYYSARELYTKTTNIGGKFNTPELMVDEAGFGYARIKYIGGTGGDGYFTLVPNVPDTGTAAGRYMVIKYRTTYSPVWEVFSGDQRYTAAGKSGSNTLTPVADGEWQLMIVDLEAIKGDKYDPVDGKYYIGHMRWDIFNSGSTADQYIDVAFVAFGDDLSVMGAIDAEKGVAPHSHTQGNNAVTAYDDNNDATSSAKRAYNCAFCGQPQVTELAITAHVSCFTNADGTDIGRTGKTGGDKGATVLDASTFEIQIADSKLGVNAWIAADGYFNGFVYRILDTEGNVLVGWTESTVANHQAAPSDAAAIVSAAKGHVPGVTADTVQRAANIADLTAAAGKTVTVEYAVVWRDAPTTGNDKYITYARINNVAVPAVGADPEPIPTYVHITNFGGKKDIAAQPSAIVDSTALTTSTTAAYLGRVYITGRVAIEGTAQKLVYRLLDTNGNQIQGWQELDYYGSNDFTMKDVTEGTAHLGTAQKVVPEVTNVYEYVGLANITAFPGQTVTVEFALVLDGVEGDAAYHTFATFKNVTNTESAS